MKSASLMVNQPIAFCFTDEEGGWSAGIVAEGIRCAVSDLFLHC